MKTFSTILVAFGFALLSCSGVSAQVTTTVDSSSSISPSSVSVTPTPTVTPSPVPNPSFNVSSFNLSDIGNSNNTCFAMTAAFQLNLTYIDTAGKKQMASYNMGNEGLVNKSASFCNSSSLQANIVIYRDTGSKDPAFSIVFHFTGNQKEEHWKINKIQVNIDTGYLGSSPAEVVMFDAVTDELIDTFVEFKRSFKCVAEQDVKFSNNTNSTMKLVPVLFVQKFQVQVFVFGNAATGEFGKVRLCSMDANKGNKIVPIAVGAALAGLVIVVLIAYLIGRLRSRRQSSYEALS